MSTDSDFGPYTALIKTIKDWVADNVTHKDYYTKNPACGCYANINPDINQWTQNDLINLAANPDGRIVFKALVDIKKHAESTSDLSGKPTEDTIYARLALDHLACMGEKTVVDEKTGISHKITQKLTWKEYSSLIGKVDKALEQAIDDKKRSHVPSEHAIQASDIKVSLQVPKRNDVQISAEQKLETPVLNRALDFVKSNTRAA